MRAFKHIALSLIIVSIALAGALSKAEAGVNQWDSIGPEGGTVHDIAVDPDTPSNIYIATNGGLYKSTNGGGSWSHKAVSPTNDGLRDVAIDPATPSTLYVAIPYAPESSKGVYKSTDSGETWAAINTGLTNTTVTSVAIDPDTTTTLYASTAGGEVFKSTSSGGSWSSSDNGIPVMSLSSMGYLSYLAIDPVTTSTLYLSSYLGLYKSTDSGANWSMINSITSGVTIDPLNTSVLYGSKIDGVYRSPDGGVSWEAANTGLSNKVITAFAIDPVTTTTLYANAYYMGSGPIGFFSHMYRSTDSGASWSQLGAGISNAIVIDIKLDPLTPTTVYAGAITFPVATYQHPQLGMYKSTDSGANWSQINSGINSLYIKNLVLNPSDPSNIYATQSCGLAMTADSGASWQYLGGLAAERTAESIAIDPVTAANLYAGIRNYIDPDKSGVIRSTDGGDSWTASGTGISNKVIAALAVDPSTPSVIYAGAGYMSMGEGLYKSTDSGASWSASKTGMGNTSVQVIVIDPSSTSTLYAATYDAGVFKSTDSGANWSAVNSGLSNTTVTALAIDPNNTNTLYAGTSLNLFALMYAQSGGGIFKSTDAGASWSAINTGLGSGDVNVIVVDPQNSSRVYAGLSHSVIGYHDGIGVYNSADGGASWGRMNEGMGNISVFDMAIDPDNHLNLYAATGFMSVVNYTIDEALGISTTPGSMDFGEVKVNSPSTTKQFTITNNGISDLTLSTLIIFGGDANDFILDPGPGPNNCVSTWPVLSPGEACTGVIAFYPLSEGAKTSSFYIYSDDPETPMVTISLSGTGTVDPVPDINVAPLSLNFGSVEAGSSSLTNTVTIENNGSANLNVSAIYLGGTNPGEFTLDLSGGSSPCYSDTLTLSSGTFCTVTVTFEPQTAGPKSAVLEVESDDPDTALKSVTIGGTGVPRPAAVISLSPQTMDMGTVNTGETSEPVSITISNGGNLDLHVLNIALSGPDSGDFVLDLSGGATPCGSASAVLAPGADCTVTVTFSPDTIGDRTASLDVSSDDPANGVASAKLSGTGNLAVNIGGGSGGGCGIVRAYGDTNAPEVEAARRFRDRYLMPYSLGRKIVDRYYRYSPLLEEFISGHRAARAAVRAIVTPIVFFVEHTPLLILCILVMLIIACGPARGRALLFIIKKLLPDTTVQAGSRQLLIPRHARTFVAGYSIFPSQISGII